MSAYCIALALFLQPPFANTKNVFPMEARSHLPPEQELTGADDTLKVTLKSASSRCSCTRLRFWAKQKTRALVQHLALEPHSPCEAEDTSNLRAFISPRRLSNACVRGLWAYARQVSGMYFENDNKHTSRLLCTCTAKTSSER